MQVIYAFPLWFLARVVFLTYSGGLTVKASLKVISYFNGSTSVLDDFVKFAEQRNIKGIQGLLTKGLMSPETMSMTWTPLCYSLNRGHMEICELLLASGADPNFHHPSNQM